jgi:hypothetical protein
MATFVNSFHKRVLEAINGNPELQERTAVIVSAAQLRSEGHNIPQTLALETRASDLWNERDKRPLKDLMECRYVLVHDLGDVFYFDNSEKQDGQRKPGKFGLYFRPYVGRPENNPDRHGKMSGFVKILIVTIVKNILGTSDRGICEGLKLWEEHFNHGFVYEHYNSEYYLKKYEQYKVGWSNSLFKEKRWHPFDRLFEAYRNMLTNIAPCKQKKNSKPGAV